nr:MAG TPA: hypothetical protein [Caudoviricetes sp.]
MNRLKFNEGGQPVYVDDLETLQENDAESMRKLLETLSGGVKAYLLADWKTEIVSVDVEKSTTTAKIYAGTAVVDGEFVSWEDTTVVLQTWNDPIYLCIKRTETDSRTFEDGQTRTCAVKTEGYLSMDNSGATESYSVYELPVMTKLVRKAIGVNDEPSYKQLKVTFRNGYSGTVAYKELADVYRYKIDIRSDNATEIKGSVDLFYCDDAMPGAQGGAFNTPTRAFVQTENGVQDFDLYAFEGEVHANVSLPFDDVSSAAGLPVKIIFDLPK